MKVKKIWVAQHPQLVGVFEVRFTEPGDNGTYLNSYLDSVEDQWVEWKEYVIIEVDNG